MIKGYSQKNKRPVPYRRHKSSGSGFVILFAVTLSSIILAISLGVANIALKEIKFGTSARDTNNAFFASDTAIEYVLFQDKMSPGPGPLFTPSPGTSETRSYVVSGLGDAGTSCAQVSVLKDNTVPPDIKTTIISKGYNSGTQDGLCVSTNPDRIERELKITY
ncbi:hypothetical protein A2818_01230 [Candidatus Nomurabacteria bacterium RIFCSPHIGHO2_01_FULL_40_12]|uniref:Type 4 fimbrial biogenesis protein PilX N-terminal domain-containing protein n=1 Tax=Candidatus Nomurabacteria bacterium RIFCSPHIGHO2_01_FULL_40_12 TaxID=1801737 RepID=A0A1F6V193_9BACT|nr:MAG: hypothetical protein A2818_01230 [Candidatus Nomurabacteria bacterium RIFCSPHIGHO2_01_FULL_40_12]